jgi:NADH:ubiquinone oxidoreductase subunit K
MPEVPMQWFLLVAAGLFSLGVYGALARRNAINVLMGIELMLNAVNLMAVTFWRYITPAYPIIVDGKLDHYIVGVDGQLLAVFVIALAAAEVAIGLALILAIYRLRGDVQLDAFELLSG